MMWSIQTKIVQVSFHDISSLVLWQDVLGCVNSVAQYTCTYTHILVPKWLYIVRSITRTFVVVVRIEEWKNCMCVCRGHWSRPQSCWHKWWPDHTSGNHGWRSSDSHPSVERRENGWSKIATVSREPHSTTTFTTLPALALYWGVCIVLYDLGELSW